MAAQKKFSNLIQWDTPLISRLGPDYARLELVEAFSEYVLFRPIELSGSLLTLFPGFSKPELAPI